VHGRSAATWSGAWRDLLLSGGRARFLGTSLTSAHRVVNTRDTTEKIPLQRTPGPTATAAAAAGKREDLLPAAPSAAQTEPRDFSPDADDEDFRRYMQSAARDQAKPIVFRASTMPKPPMTVQPAMSLPPSQPSSRSAAEPAGPIAGQPKSVLNEFCQRERIGQPVYTATSAGLDHLKTHT
jgi:hypothetical protein